MDRLALRAGRYCPLVYYDHPRHYHQHFVKAYCVEPLLTFDSIRVTFDPFDFAHAFYEGRDKELFSVKRARRIDWIRKALTDPSAKLFLGLHPSGRAFTPRRRVCLANNNYVVVIEFMGPREARFVTAFVAGSGVKRLIEGSPPWPTHA